MTAPSNNDSVVLLDTSVQIDRIKSKWRRVVVETLLAPYTFSVSTSISLLEFKATLIQECITIHDNLRLKKQFTVVRDALCEKNSRQVKLRMHIFDNFIGVFANSFEVTPEKDVRLAEKARLLLEQKIPRIHRWFVNDSAGMILRDGVNCTRAFEEPKKKKSAFGVNLPQCKRGENKDCNIEEFIREKASPHLDGLSAIASNSQQLENALGIFMSVITDPSAQLSHSACRNAGDCLIAMEAEGVASDVLSTNAAEWQHLASLLGYRFSKVEYPDERTR